MEYISFHTKNQRLDVDHRKVQLEEIDGGFRVTLHSGQESASRDFLESDGWDTHTKYLVFLSFTDGVVLEKDWRFSGSVENKTAFMTHYRVIDDVAFNFYYATSFADSCVYANWILETDVDVTVRDPEWISTFLAAKYPEHNDYHRKLLAKRNAVLKVNNTDSIVALEQQVDLLTKAVKALANGTDLPDWFNDFVSKVEAADVTTQRTEAEVIQDIESHKTFLRGVQQTYFTERSATE